MIFVAVGTQKFQFNRLLKEIDRIIENELLHEEVYAQIGFSDYMPENYHYDKMMDKDKYDLMIENCDLLITHSGVGTIVSGLKCSKPVIVVPRLKEYNEHVDDHQVQIADAFSEKNLILKCEDTGDLVSCIEEAKRHTFSRYVSKKNAVVDVIENFLSTLG